MSDEPLYGSVWRKRGKNKMPVINHQEIPEIEMRPGIRGQFLASVEHGARGVCLLVNTVDPGTAVPLHKHTVEETMLVLEGTV
jgi:quercetin dioxygenase-like cupin family protein